MLQRAYSPAALVAALALFPATATPQSPPLALTPLVTGLDSPVGGAHAGDGSGRLFVVERGGRVRIVEGGDLLPEPFLDIGHLIVSGGEQGLLGLAFHPRYEENGLFFVDYTRAGSGDTVIARYRVSTDPDRADPSSGREILTVEQPFANHNGGDLRFGPDGYLYVALGDGGSGGDPLRVARDLDSLLGKLLRLDVDGAFPYAVPPDNPFVGKPGREEIWALGLRNPWRFSFDRATGDLFVGDVGQGEVEEIDLLPAGVGGLDLGWSCYEGSRPFALEQGCDGALTFPIVEYDHGLGCSVSGGFRYRGAIPELFGDYLFGDFCSGRIWRARPVGPGWSAEVWLDTDLRISSFGEDEAGELLVVDIGGTVYRVTGGGGGDGGGNDGPRPPAGPWLRSPELRGFEIKARITSDSGQPAVRREPTCLAEALCVSGALPGRPEVLVRVVGPRPNGRLWPIIVRLTPSRVEVWIRQLATGAVRYYDLPASGLDDRTLEGLFDPDGFVPQ